MSRQKISPCLWFDDRIEEAVDFYVSVFGGRVTERAFYPESGRPLTIGFEVGDQQVIALNGGPHFTFNEAVSFFVWCEDQAEIDHYWRVLTADGGQESQCGWLKDKYGLSWQLAPKAMERLMLHNEDPAQAARVMQAMMQMKKIEIAVLERAYAG